ncbi:MAG: T9SS type A sorting domain-containing protein [Candidatus Symbiothrix sp.]|jgi:ELWxxDGT repeat protein|nr:T9SS type A sorting domain-containing protein [Candidatus Symbiothrix sp.]
MKKKFLLVSALFAGLVSNLFAEGPVLPQGMEILTPEGVTVTTTTDLTYDKKKPITISGSKQAGYKAYFTASDSEHGEELWISDGTAAGTKMVKDIYPGPTSSDVGYITRFKDKVVFQARANEEDETELWISDGTTAGTYMILDINMVGSSNPCGFTWLDENRFIFAATDYESAVYGDSEQQWLWISDGTESGTQLLKDCRMIYPGVNANSDGRHFERVGRKVFFKADTKDNEYGEELWVTNGTPEGTIMLGDINQKPINEGVTATSNANIGWMTNFKNEKLFFIAYSDEYGNEPHVSDGTPEGTYLIADMAEGVNAQGNPNGAGAYTARTWKDHVYFRGHDPAYGMELFKTDFTREGTVMVADLNTNPTATGTAHGNPDLHCEFDGVLFLKAATGSDAAATNPINYGLELFYTDGTTEGTIMQSDLNPGIGPNAAWEGIVISGSFFFRAQDQTPPTGSSQFWELFSMDSKDEFPHKVVDLGEGPDFVHTLRNLNGELVFTSTIIPSLFKYHYRKPNYDAAKDTEEMDPVFGQGESGIVETEIAKIASAILYPNPASDVVNISSTFDIAGYTIRDMSGRTLVSQQGNEKIIPVSNLNKGTYIVTVNGANENAKSLLIVK